MTQRRVLIVEDEILLGDDCAALVKEAGFDVAGPYSRLEDVPQDLVGISGAILDVNIGGKSAYGLIDRLLEMNIPVIMYTGYRDGPPKYASVLRGTKPAPCRDAVLELIRQLLN
jgi:FixJ family two-component response regulator